MGPQGPDLSAHITIHEPAAPLTRVLADLSAKAHITFSASPRVADDVVVIDAKDVTIKDLMDRIALADSASWKLDAGTYLLTQDTVARRTEANKSLQFRAALIKAAIEKRLNPGGADKSKATAAAAVIPTSPDEKAFNGILTGISPAVLASIHPGTRVVFSTSPTRMQVAFDRNVNSVVEQWVKEHNAVAPKALEAQDQMLKAMGSQLPAFLVDVMKAQTRVVDAPITKVLLIAQTMPYLGGLQLSLRGYDGDGKVQISGTTMLAGIDPTTLVNFLDDKPEVTNAKETPIEYSEDSKALNLVLSTPLRQMGTEGSAKVTPELRAKMLQPEKIDPLSLIPSDAAFAYAKYKGKPLVAVLPDAAMPPMISFKSRPKTVEAYAKSLAVQESLQEVADPSWVVLKPADPVDARESRVNRRALAKLLHAASEKEVPSLDDLAEYAQEAPAPSDNVVSQTYLSLLAPSTTQEGIGGAPSWDMIRFYGGLPLTMRANLKNGAQIPLSSLTPDQTATLAHMIYGSKVTLDVNRPGKPVADDFLSRAIRSALPSAIDYRDEPTESLPNGLPSDGVLNIKATTSGFVRIKSPYGGVGFSNMGADEVAALRYMKKSPGFSALVPGTSNIQKGKVGERTVLDFLFQLAPDISVKQTLNVDTLSDSAQTVGLDELPSSLESQVAERMKGLDNSGLGAFLTQIFAARNAGARP